MYGENNWKHTTRAARSEIINFLIQGIPKTCLTGSWGVLLPIEVQEKQRQLAGGDKPCVEHVLEREEADTWHEKKLGTKDIWSDKNDIHT